MDYEQVKTPPDTCAGMTEDIVLLRPPPDTSLALTNGPIAVVDGSQGY